MQNPKLCDALEIVKRHFGMIRREIRGGARALSPSQLLQCVI